MKFAFKKTPKTGRYGPFQDNHTDVKPNGKVCSSISERVW